MASAPGSSERNLFLCGDVMTGRGIDQVLQRPSEPQLYESYVRHAERYVELAEAASGPIARPVPDHYIWGDALAELDSVQPALRLINLETSITTHNTPWPSKGIHYRMQPANIGCLLSARVNCCAVANNHLLDWGRPGLRETLDTLRQAGIPYCGAGASLAAARQPAAIALGQGQRALVLACGSRDSGIPADWAATAERSGVHLLPAFSAAAIDDIAAQFAPRRQPGDIAIVSVHWGSNWGDAIDSSHREFAHQLIERAGVDLVHGHSSHHPRAIEVHRGRLILYGCGDFINDYEGISGYEPYRGDLVLMYFPRIAANGELRALNLVPMQLHRFRLRHASKTDADWLAAMLTRVSRKFGTRVKRLVDNSLALEWR